MVSTVNHFLVGYLVAFLVYITTMCTKPTLLLLDCTNSFQFNEYIAK
jgi:hypothetical protein